jgi:hypothetical protein
MMGLGLLGKVADLAGTMIEGKTAVKQAEAQTKMKIATGELDWDLAAMKATENSWKDEWITLLFSIPLILAFCGDWGNQIVQAGFAALADMPGWYQYSLGGIVSASIGMRGVSKYFGNKK